MVEDFTVMIHIVVLALMVSMCFANQHTHRLQPVKQIFRDGVPLEREQNQIISPPGTAPDYGDPSAPRFEGSFNSIPSVTGLAKEAEVTAFARIVTRQAPTEAPKGEGAKSPSFFFELVRAIADLGHGVFSLLGLATGGS